MNEIDWVELLNDNPGGFNRVLGLRFSTISADEVVAELDISEVHYQAYGIVHGGVYSGIIETVCSVGAAVNAAAAGQPVVGLENHTSFLRAARSGKLRVIARPLVRGRRSHVWEAAVDDGAGRLLATGRVRVLCLEPGSALAGQPVSLREARHGT
jgi:1,4-dihydroxy-2-naphthoyl-CoA hydrolase